jgi:hypothetical protein
MNVNQCLAMAEIHDNSASVLRKQIQAAPGHYELRPFWEMERNIHLTHAAAYRAAAAAASSDGERVGLAQV